MVKKRSIIPAETAVETFRDSGYKNTASALAELIDNSIEAGAKDIQIIAFEEQKQLQRRVSYQIQEIAVYDNGAGMSPSTLEICLQFGNGTRLKSRSGMGRFGIGLPNASISQASRVEVFSWQDGSSFSTYLDVEEIKENNQQFVNPVIKKKVPKKYLDAFDGGISKSGTLIIWKKCDRLDIRRSRSLLRILHNDLCRIYRHHLDADNSYGEQVEIKLISEGKKRHTTPLLANDPLYLMTPNNVPGKKNEATNIMHGDKYFEIPIQTNSGVSTIVEVRFSVALPESQKLGGSSPLGQHYKRNVGISFVRVCREIDFGSFHYFNINDERERWWGCEVRFDPIADEVFGVTNNKQAVRGISYLDEKEFKKEYPDEWEETLEQEPKIKLRYELSKIFRHNHKQIMDIVTSRGVGTRSVTIQERTGIDKPTKIANEQLKDEHVETKSILDGKNKSEDEKKLEHIEGLLQSDTSLGRDEAEAIAVERVNLLIDKEFSSWPGSQFITIETRGQTCVLVINRRHPFFNDLYNPLVEKGDDKYIDALDLTLMAYARMEDELYSRVEDLDDIREIWGRHLKQFLTELKKDA